MTDASRKQGHDFAADLYRLGVPLLPKDKRWSALAQYNDEVGRGIVHTPEWDALMAEELERFNTEIRKGWVEEGGVLYQKIEERVPLRQRILRRRRGST